ncbi:response regulator [Candidatus Dependentiae bacterium]|nr:response regulator [Candidatus Dependentiae bacterium]
MNQNYNAEYLSGDSPKILIIDDDNDIQRVITTIFKKSNFKVLNAYSGKEGLAAAETHHPDIILLDILMPGMDGFEVCKILKENIKTQKIPVIFLTAQDEPEHIARGLNLGAIDYITKPFSPDTLVNRISVHFQLIKIKEHSKTIENKLIDTEIKYTSLIKNIPISVFEMDSAGKILFVNENTIELLKYPSETIINFSIKQLLQIIHPEDIRNIENEIKNFIKSPMIYDIDFRIKRNDEKYIWINCRAVKITDNGNIKSIYGVLTDITENKRRLLLEKSLESQKLFSSISERFINSENFDEDIKITLNYLVAFSNISRCSIYKFNEDLTECSLMYEGVKNNSGQLKSEKKTFPSSDIEPVIKKITKNKIAIINDTETLNEISEIMYNFFKVRSVFSSIIMPLNIDEKLFGFMTFSDMEKKHTWQEYELSTIKIAAGIISKAFSNFFKTRQIKENFSQLVQSAKLASIGTMVAGVAHEINNPNTFITLNIPIISECWSELKKKLIDDSCTEQKNTEQKKILSYIENIDKSLGHISIGSSRIQNIVNTLKEFSQNENIDNIKNFSIKECIEKAYTIVGAMTRRKVYSVEINIPENIPFISGNQIKIEQVIINLLQNAADAVNDIRQGYIKINCELINNKFIRISIKDNGKGIKKENLTKIFEPFFTTKHEISGTGLGLSISYKIIKEHNGSISVLSDENEGTVFIIDLPVIADIKAEKIKPLLLIVDDEIEFTKVLASFYKRNNIECITLNNPLLVIDIISKNINIDIILTDINMPNMDGFELMGCVKEKFPWIKFIYMSGIIHDDEVEKLFEFGAKAYFKKPFTDFNFLIKKIIELR